MVYFDALDRAGDVQTPEGHALQAAANWFDGLPCSGCGAKQRRLGILYTCSKTGYSLCVACVAEIPGQDGPAVNPAPRVPPLWEIPDEEFERLPRPEYVMNQVKITKPQLKKIVDEQLPGDHYGMLFPHSLELIKSMGAAWLTQAFRAAGTLPRDNAVRTLKEVIGLSLDPTKGEAMGGAAVKVLLRVEYEKPHRDLHTELFVKLPHPFSPANERHKISCVWFCDEPEIMFNRVLSSSVPFRVPKYYFGDISRKNTNCILICEALKFPKEVPHEPLELWPATEKNKDFELPGKGQEYYYAMAACHAKFVAAYFTDRLGDKWRLGQIFANFNPDLVYGNRHGPPMEPFDGDASKYFAAVAASNMQQAAGMSALGCDFTVGTAPQLFPKALANRKWLEQFRKECIHVHQYKGEMDHWCHSFTDYFSLSHANMNIDNAFYWLNEDRKLEAGFLDWGSFSHSNYIMSMVGNWISAEAEVFEEHEENLIDYFIDQLHKCGGPKLDQETTMFHAKLCQAGSLFGHVGNLTQLYSMHKKKDPIWQAMKDRFDDRIRNVFLMRAFVNNWRNFLLLWSSKKRGPYKWFLKWVEKYKVTFGAKGPPLATTPGDF